MQLVILSTVSFMYVYFHGIVLLLEKSPCDSKSVSSLGSCDSDQPSLKSLDIPLQAATDVIQCQADTDNASSDWRLAEPAVDISQLVSDDLSNCCPTSKEVLNDSDVALNVTGMESSCWTVTDVPQTDVLRTASSFINADCISDKNDGSRNTSETSTSVYDHALLDCNTSQLLGDYVEAVIPLQNCIPKDSTANSEGCAATGLQSASSLKISKFPDAVEGHSGAISVRLGKSIDSAFKSRGVKPTIMSPSDDFQSIYASGNISQTSSFTTHEVILSMPESTHGYQDLASIDAWLEFPVPEKSTALSLCVSRRTVWYIDKTERLYYSSLKGPGLSWNTDSQPAEQISCSPSGFIIWRVYRGSAYSAIGRITAKSPAGTEWREVAREVAYVAADDSVVW